MLHKLSKFFRSSRPPRLPAVPVGTRYYIIGDIHGRLDLYDALIREIENKITSAPDLEHRIVLLGDLVDRGPDSAGVIARTRAWQQQRNVRVLAGNHEEMLLAAFDKPEALRHFLKHGGYETVLSYGLPKKQLASLTLEELFEILPNIIPQSERDYIASFETMIIAGDYALVHAGIDPSVPLTEQKRSDLLWIRERFLSHEGPLEKVIVHGHTVFDRAINFGNRIGIDTGAFFSGVLTALVLEGEHRKIVQACAADGGTVEIFEDNRAF